MLKIVSMALSIFFLGPLAVADVKMVRNGVCHSGGRDYILLDEQPLGLVANHDYMIFEKNPLAPTKLPRSLQGKFTKGAQDLMFPGYWRPTSIPLSTCQAEKFKFHLFDEVIREFYVKSYFMYGDPRPIQDDIEDLVKRGEAIPVKVRVLCKSDDITDDITLCHELTVLDKIIPIDPNDSDY